MKKEDPAAKRGRRLASLEEPNCIQISWGSVAIDEKKKRRGRGKLSIPSQKKAYPVKGGKVKREGISLFHRRGNA